MTVHYRSPNSDREYIKEGQASERRSLVQAMNSQTKHERLSTLKLRIASAKKRRAA